MATSGGISVKPVVKGGIFLPPPKLRLVSSPTATATLNDGNSIEYHSVIEVTLWNISDVHLLDATYDLGLELFRRKTHVRHGSDDKYGRNGIVHTVHRAAGIDAAILLGNTSGNAPSLNGQDRFTEWKLSGLSAGAKVVIDPATSMLQFFEYAMFGYVDSSNNIANDKYIRYINGEYRNKGNFLTLNTRNGVGYINPTGVFYFAYSIFDQESKRRIRGPMSQPIIVNSKHPPTVQAWKDLSFNNGKHRHKNPNYQIKEMSFRLGSYGFNDN